MEDDRLAGTDMLSIFAEWLDASSKAVIETGPDLETITSFARECEPIFGRKAEDVIGTKVRDLYEFPTERDKLMKKLLFMGPGGKIDYETKFVKSIDDGSTVKHIDVHFQLALRHDKDGKPCGTRGFVEDITERKAKLIDMVGEYYHKLYEYSAFLSDHTQKVSRFSEIIAERLGMTKWEIFELGIAVLFHDIGKMKLEKDILNNGRTYLEQDEGRAALRKHCELGEQRLQKLGMPRKFQVVAKYHHERWDGDGYFRLKGEETPIYSRIVAVADAFDSMTEDRNYRLKMSKHEAVEELKRCSGRDFDRAALFSYNRRALKYVIDKEVALIQDEDENSIALMISREINNVVEMTDEKEMYMRFNDTLSSHRQHLDVLKHGTIVEFLSRAEKHAENYLVSRKWEELQFDPHIAGVFTDFLEQTSDPLR